ncbi:hypothetical protein [Streptosporangium sp. NPDC051022]|uniref:hypothetical protein n=1 Tax=Streptosporangium sp. NPDC051022 TaxID=3155752 RepID=UPI003412B5C3
MSRRVLTLFSGAVLAVTAVLTAASPAQAQIIEAGESPISTGEYCAAKVDSASGVGLFERGSLRCYDWNLTFKGTGDPYEACRFRRPDRVVVGVKEGLPSHYLICLLQV